MSASPTIEWLPFAIPNDSGIDRKTLAGLLLEIAQDLQPELRLVQNGSSASDLRLQQLRTLVLGGEIEVLSRLQGVLEDPEKLAAVVARSLPTAIAEASRDARLGTVLVPAIEKAAESSIRKNPQTLVDILYPLMVPTIGKSIRETIAATFQSLNLTLKYSLTWRGLKWRWEAWRSGASFAEVVLRHTLVYQVEHVFLIHRDTGLLILNVAAEGAASQDPQLISSMLVAIQSFVRDSFTGAEYQGFDTVQLGEFRLWCESGPFAMLVAVIRGDPPEEFNETLRNALSRIHAERRHALESFDGDSAGFVDIEAQLRECLVQHQLPQPKPTKLGRVAVIALLVAITLLAGGPTFWWWERHRAWQAYVEQERAQQEARLRRWEGYISQLHAEPGIVVTEQGQRDGEFFVAGLRDPLAVDPEMLLDEAGVDPSQVVSSWAPYQALNPQFVLRRLQVSLDPPQTVSLAVDGDRIVARGSASPRWLERARLAGRMLTAGGPALDLSGVGNLFQGAVGKLRDAIESRVIHFVTGGSLPAPGQEAVLDQQAEDIKQVATVSAAMGVTTRVTLIGHADSAGQETSNLSLSLARAEAVRVLLQKRGVNPRLLAVRGAGALEPLQEETSDASRSADRRVSFSLGIDEEP